MFWGIQLPLCYHLDIAIPWINREKNQMIDLMLVLTLVSWALPLMPTDWPDEATNTILHISCIINLWVELTQNYLSNSVKWLQFTSRFIANFASQVFMKIHPANFPFHPLEYCFVTTFLHGFCITASLHTEVLLPWCRHSLATVANDSWL